MQWTASHVRGTTQRHFFRLGPGRFVRLSFMTVDGNPGCVISMIGSDWREDGWLEALPPTRDAEAITMMVAAYVSLTS